MRHPRALTTLLAFAFTLCLALPALALTPIHIWSKGLGNTNNDVGYAVATDPSGNVIVTGLFNGTVNFGGSNLVSAGLSDIFIAKYDAAGVHQWSQRFGGTGSDFGSLVATDASGNVYLLGEFSNTVNFGGGNLASAGSLDIVVAKYSAAGAYQWAQRFGNTAYDAALGMTVDSSANVIVTGYLAGTVNYGGINLVSNGGSPDVFMAKYNSAGVHQWSQRFGGTSIDIGVSVATDASGNVYFTGDFQGTSNFGGSNLVSAGDYDVVVAKYNSAGVHQWSQRFGSTSTDQSEYIASDASGNIHVTGFFSGTVDFGGGGLVSVGSFDMFLAKYNSAGAHQWSKAFGSPNQEQGASLRVDNNGDVIVTGSFMGTVNFGGGNLTSAGSTEIFLAKYDDSGAYQWAQRFGSTSGDYGYGVALDASNNVIVTGAWDGGTVNFGGNDIVGVGSNDIFLAKFGPDAKEPSITAITDIGNDQGRKVKVRFAHSGHDAAASATPVVSYEVYRRDNAPPAMAAGVSLAAPAGAETMSQRAMLDLGWTFVGDVPAHGQSSYAIDVPTIGDSTITLGQYYSTFFVRGASSAMLTYFDSPVDSGYSVDNLAPGVPQNLVYNAGGLAWNQSSATDFDFFSVYGANTNSFGAATLVDYSVAHTMDVTASPYVFYFVTATDFSGNEGKPAMVNTLSGVGGTPKSYVLSVSNYPNPFNPRTTVTYTAPSPGEVRVHIYDARGAMVKTLFEGHRVAGAYSVDWDGRADNGAAVASGLYFARIEHASGVRTKKMVLLK